MASRSNWEAKTNSALGKVSSAIADAVLRFKGKPTNAFEAELDIEAKKEKESGKKKTAPKKPERVDRVIETPFSEYGKGGLNKTEEEMKKLKL